MKTSKYSKAFMCAGITLAATATSQAAMIVAGTSIGFDFGSTAPTNNFNAVDGGPNGTTATAAAGTVIDTNGVGVDNVSFTIAGATFNSFFNNDPEVPSTFGVAAPAFYNDSNTNDWYGTFNNAGQPVTLTFSGLDDSLTYDLNIFSGINTDPNGNDQTIIVDYTIGATTLTATADLFLLVLTPFVDFSGLSSSGGELVVTMTPGTGSLAALNTISALHLTAVPEPSSAALLGLGGLSLLVRRKRSNA